MADTKPPATAEELAAEIRTLRNHAVDLTEKCESAEAALSKATKYAVSLHMQVTDLHAVNLRVVETLETLNSALDAYWNDSSSVEGRNEFPKEIHIKTITKAQQECLAALSSSSVAPYREFMGAVKRERDECTGCREGRPLVNYSGVISHKVRAHGDSKWMEYPEPCTRNHIREAFAALKARGEKT